jgi:DNA-binding HxlR family transcriptional regulator
MSENAFALCPRFHQAVELIGKRWTGAIIRILQQGGARFNAIAAAIPELSDRMLAERLRELEHEGIIARLVIPETPVRVEYELTDKGKALDAAFCALAQWAEKWVTYEPPVPEGADGAEQTGAVDVKHTGAGVA